MAPEVEVVVGYHSHCCTDQEAEAVGCRSHYSIDQDLDRVEGEVAGCIYDIHIRRKG